MNKKCFDILTTFIVILTTCGGFFSCQPAWSADSAYIEEMTTNEVASALADGRTTIIIPLGGTEQNGPHMPLGKHNTRVHILAGRIAQELGNALVAPVLAYVPEGNIHPPTEHMRFAGTISISDAAFQAVLSGAANSFRQHGFQHVVLLGDSGNYQQSLQALAEKLNQSWASHRRLKPSHVHYIGAYYAATQTTYIQALKSQGLTDIQIGTHAAVADTSLLMAVAPQMVKPALFATAAAQGKAGGTGGDPRMATAALGRLGVDAIVSQTVAAIRAVTGGGR